MQENISAMNLPSIQKKIEDFNSLVNNQQLTLNSQQVTINGTASKILLFEVQY